MFWFDFLKALVKGFWDREPVYFIAVVQAAIALVVAFGLNLSAGQITAILAFVAALLSFLTRSRVSPVPPKE